MAVIEVDGAGVRAASLSDNRQDLDRRQMEALGSDLSLSPQTPQSQWSGIMALLLTELGEAGVRAALYGSSVDHAEGVHLDALGSLLDIRRRQATRSRVTVTLTGVAGVHVPAGQRIRTDPGGDEFLTVDEVVLSPSGVTVEAEAADSGPVAAPAGTLTDIVTVLAGWEGATNTHDAALGRAIQSDADFRAAFMTRTAHSSIGSLSALEAALNEALAGRVRVEDNPTNAAVVRQDFTLLPHSILVIAESGADGDIRRAVENHRGMGVATNVAIIGGQVDFTAWRGFTDGSFSFNGVTYSNLNFSGSTSARLDLLNTTLPEGVTAMLDGSTLIIEYAWMPDETPMFGSGALEQAMGLDPDSARYPAGPFIRPSVFDISVSFTLERRTGFPADGLARVRAAVLERVAEYGIGEEVWANDLLCAAEAVAGTRVTNLSITIPSGTNQLSGLAVPLYQIYRLTTANLTITVS